MSSGATTHRKPQPATAAPGRNDAGPPERRGIHHQHPEGPAAYARCLKRRRLCRLLHFLVRPAGYLEFTDVYSIHLDSLPPVRPVAGYAIERAVEQDIAFILDNFPHDEPPHVIQDLWHAGHTCFVARHRGQVVAYNWIACSDVQEQEYAVSLQAGDVCCLKAFTLAKHRGKGLHGATLLAMLHHARDKGQKRAFTLVSLYNVNSWKSHLRMGWTRQSTVCWFRPYFTPGRVPRQLTRVQYPARLNWRDHSWFPAAQA